MTISFHYGIIIHNRLGKVFLSILHLISARTVKQEEVMFAIIETGGKQYKVTKDLIIRVEKLDIEIGEKVEFDALLAEIDGKVQVGNPKTNVKVSTEVVRHGRGDKIVVFKYESKKRARTKKGHRQSFTELKVLSIG